MLMSVQKSKEPLFMIIHIANVDAKLAMYNMMHVMCTSSTSNATITAVVTH